MKLPSTNETRTAPVPTELSETDYHRLMTAERRRLALELLASETAPVALTELAELVADAEANDTETGTEAIDRVALSLHHLHLPKMAEFDAIEYDAKTNRVTACPEIP